jgi:2-dehydro-3-deoxygluconokinase
MNVDVLTLGEAMASFRTDSMLRMGGPVTLSIAGAESNVAIGLTRLGHRTRWVGRVGDDELGALVLRTLRAEGVDVEHVVVAPGELTGVVLFERGPGGGERVHYRRSTSAARNLSPDDLDAPLREGARILHFTGITPALGELPTRAVQSCVEAIHRAGGTVSLDVNLRTTLSTAGQAAASLRPLLPFVDVLVASEDELPIVSDAPTEEAQAKELFDIGVREVVVKRGDRGATVQTRDETVSSPAPSVRVVSPIGAGDAFTAGYLSGVLDELPIAGRLARAVTLGAAAVASAGDWEGLPTRAELDQIAPRDVLR